MFFLAPFNCVVVVVAFCGALRLEVRLSVCLFFSFESMDTEKKIVEMKKYFKKECTVEVVLDKEMKAGELIDYILNVHKEGEILACVPRGKNVYEITFEDERQARIFAEEEEMPCNGQTIKMNLIYVDSVVVSFMHLPAYIKDDEIIKKLTDLDVEILSPVKRRMHDKTNIADGTRYVRVRFPPKIKSLPYSMKFNTVEGLQYFRVLHNNQLKVCYQCLEDTHIIKNCPYTKCYKCNEIGHIAKKCTKSMCDSCKKADDHCTCKNVEINKDKEAEHILAEQQQKEISEPEKSVNTHVQSTGTKDNCQSAKYKKEESADITEYSSEWNREEIDTEDEDRKMNESCDSEKEVNEKKRRTRRHKLVKRPSKDTVLSLVEKRKRERKDSDERQKDECRMSEERMNGENKSDPINKKKK